MFVVVVTRAGNGPVMRTPPVSITTLFFTFTREIMFLLQFVWLVGWFVILQFFDAVV